MSPELPEPYAVPGVSILSLVIRFNPWSTEVVIVWAVPVWEVILEILTPISVSELNLFKVSLVTLFWTSLTTTSPTKSGVANETVGSGSDAGLSLFVCG